MTTKGVVIFIVIVIVVILAVFAFFPKQKPSTGQPPKTTEITPPAATGNVDDLMAATIKEITDEDLLLKDEENDTSFITLDRQEVSDFGQTINESDF